MHANQLKIDFVSTFRMLSILKCASMFLGIFIHRFCYEYRRRHLALLTELNGKEQICFDTYLVFLFSPHFECANELEIETIQRLSLKRESAMCRMTSEDNAQ